MELHEKTAAAEALACSDDERRWCQVALSALPEDQAKRFGAIPQDVREFTQNLLVHCIGWHNAGVVSHAHTAEHAVICVTLTLCARMVPTTPGRCSVLSGDLRGRKIGKLRPRRCVICVCALPLVQGRHTVEGSASGACLLIARCPVPQECIVNFQSAGVTSRDGLVGCDSPRAPRRLLLQPHTCRRW
jgi:hypothetical protein